MLSEFYSKINTKFLVNIPLLSVSLGWATLFGAVFYRSICNIVYKNNLFYQINSVSEKELIILRGVPGIGKNNYVLNEELCKKGIYAVVANDDFFIKDGKYVFEREFLNKSNAWAFDQFLTYLELDVPRIYIANFNNKIWNYSNYIKLATSKGYKIKIIEFKCNDINELRYFNKRSVHNIPYSYSKKIYDDWDEDTNSIFIEPYIGTHEGYPLGDTIPNYPKKTKEELDKELDDYFTRKIDISHQDTEYNNNDNSSEIVDKICKEDIDYISSRRLYIFKSEQHKNYNYFKCGNLEALKPVNKNLINYDIDN